MHGEIRDYMHGEIRSVGFLFIVMFVSERILHEAS